MEKQLGNFLTTAGLAAAIAFAPLAASATSAERSYQLRARIVEQSPSVGEFDGLLQLRISPDGIISGYYRPDDNTRFINVTGGISGDKFWIDVGSLRSNPWRFSGTFSDGHIDAASSQPIVDSGRYTGLNLTATPVPN